MSYHRAVKVPRIDTHFVGFAALSVILGGNFGNLMPGFLIPTALLIYSFVFTSASRIADANRAGRECLGPRACERHGGALHEGLGEAS